MIYTKILVPEIEPGSAYLGRVTSLMETYFLDYWFFLFCFLSHVFKTQLSKRCFLMKQHTLFSLFFSFYWEISRFIMMLSLVFWGLFSKFSCHMEDGFWLLGSIVINIIFSSLSRFLKSQVLAPFCFYCLKSENTTAPCLSPLFPMVCLLQFEFCVLLWLTLLALVIVSDQNRN